MGVNLATNRTLVWKWEHGQVPDVAAQLVLADLLGVPAAEVHPELWPTWLPIWEVACLDAPWSTAGTVEVLEDLIRSADMDRRGFLTITGTSLTALAANWASTPSAYADAANGGRVDDEMVSGIEQRVASLRRLDDQMGGARLLDQARTDLSLVTLLLREGRYTEAAGARLHSLAAQVAYLTGWMAYDSGLHSVGQRYYVAALRAARTAGDDDLGAFLLAEMGVHASDGGYNRERASLIDTALSSTTAKVPTKTRAYLYLHLAAALAQQAEHKNAAGALQRAVTLYDKGGEEPCGEWLTWFGPSQIDSTRGKVMLWAGQPEPAIDALAASVDAAVPRDKAVRAGRLAEARLAGGDLDGALAAAHQGMALLEGRVASNRAVDRLQEFSSRLNGKEPAVREFRDRLRSLPELAA
jgi:hypothetical protein